MFACQLVGSLAHVRCLKEILAPETHQFLGDTERSTNVVNRHGDSLIQFAQDRLQVLLRLDLLILETALSRQDNWLLFGSFEFSSLINYVGSICIHQLPIIVLDQHLEGLRSVSLALCTRVRRNPDHSKSVQLAEVVVLELLANRPRDHITRGSLAPLELIS